jgi:hypothetical protein
VGTGQECAKGTTADSGSGLVVQVGPEQPRDGIGRVAEREAGAEEDPLRAEAVDQPLEHLVRTQVRQVDVDVRPPVPAWSRR